jgi:DNA-binding transcriptional LysR family regulator
MELYQLAYFMEIARQRHFTRAAIRLNVAQPALSQQIQKLEAELGTRLFLRGARQTVLTAAGEAFFPRVQAILSMAALAKEAVAEVTELRRGRLVIASIPTMSAYWLPRVIKRFRNEYPLVELVLREENSDSVASLVLDGVAELGFLQFPVDSEKFENQVLVTEPFMVLVHRDHSLAKRRSVQLSQLKQDSFIFYKGKVRLVASAACRAAGFEPRSACESQELETIRALVAAKLGVALLPRSALPKLPSNLVALGIREPPLVRQVGMIMLREQILSAAAKAFKTAVEGR